ncbi:MAG: ArsR/SmtB family transcription factor [Candidatus Hadarchaeaceae archaeon]|nr:metalloregulator ArsR/SmtB family transcription factor [Hadesarchaea archaeon]
MTKNQLRLLKCVADETRLQILLRLKTGERCVCEIMDELDKEQSLISHHLQALRKCGFIHRRREGKKIMYRLSDPSILEFLADVKKLSKKLC